MNTPFTSALTDALFEAINTANLARSAANAAEPYAHDDYEAQEKRLERLVAVLADGDDDLADAFSDALFDITHDGVAWARKVFDDIKRELEDDRSQAWLLDVERDLP